jgi:hypothetical protein
MGWIAVRISMESTNPCSKERNAGMKGKTMFERAGSFTLALGLCHAAAGAELHDNGAPTLATVNNQYQNAMDDFYVPGAGWFVDGAETVGMFLNPGRTVQDVAVVLWSHDPIENEPDGAHTLAPTVSSWSVTSLGDDGGGYEELRVEVEFEETFLDGQAYHWIEFEITDQYGLSLHLKQSAEDHWSPAHTRQNPYPNATANDLSFSVHGTEVETLYVGPTDDLASEGFGERSGIVQMLIPDGNAKFPSGLYEIAVIEDRPQVVLLDDRGRTRMRSMDLTADPRRPRKLHTPAGDDLCGKAKGSLHDYCQTFVACAAYDLFCWN